MNKPFELTLWQKKQAALLYHFASLDYLKGLQQRLNEFMGVVDPTLDLAKAQGRDAVLTDKRWGNRDTSENWANHAWGFLKDFQLKVAKDIANRPFEIYAPTDVNYYARGISESSMAWATLEEEEKFDAMFRAISQYAGYIDDTMQKTYQTSRWDDFCFTLAWEEFNGQFPKLPQLRVRTDIEGETDKVPVRTGVYIPQDDPHGSLQFAWVGGGRGELLESSTFNALGLAAFQFVGRKDLWVNGDKMLAFVQANIDNADLQSDWAFQDSLKPKLAPSLVARNAFTSRPCKWYYVELIDGEFEDIVDEPTAATPQQDRLRIEGGQPCPQRGYWFTPAKMDSRRYFKEGESMPTFSSAYGTTIWQWDPNQG